MEKKYFLIFFSSYGSNSLSSKKDFAEEEN